MSNLISADHRHDVTSLTIRLTDTDAKESIQYEACNICERSATVPLYARNLWQFRRLRLQSNAQRNPRTVTASPYRPTINPNNSSFPFFLPSPIFTILLFSLVVVVKCCNVFVIHLVTPVSELLFSERL